MLDVRTLTAFAEAARHALIVFDADWRVTCCNAAAADTSGQTVPALAGSDIEVTIPGLRSAFESAARAGSRLNDQGTFEHIIELSCGEWVLRITLDADDRPTGGFCVRRSASTESRVADELRDSELRFLDFVECASDWFWETDHELRYSYLSERYLDATGLPPQSRLGFRRGEFRLSGPEDGDWASHLADLKARRPFRDFVFAYMDTSGRRRVAKVSGRPVFNANGEFLGYRGVGRDITVEIEAQNQLRFLAQHDPLTSLPNRNFLTTRLKEMLDAAHRFRTGLAVLSIDLDDFKMINDTMGHAAGDALLCEVANRMREAIRSTDVVARMGGDEFTIIQPGARNEADAQALARRLIDRISQPIARDGEQIRCHASIGVSLYPKDGREVDELLRHADLALYKAKALGRGNCVVFLPEMNAELQERRTIETELREALGQDRLMLYYQPQVDLRTGQIGTFEALLRWAHPVRGILAPGCFLQVAERCGLILAIDRWVLRAAAVQARRWRDAGLFDGRIAVNLSAVQLSRGDLVEYLTAVCSEVGVPPDALEIEITESALLTDTEAVSASLRILHDMGVTFSVDDFGTGFSSLTYLRRFPVHKVKIDRSFVRNLCTGAEDACIVRAIVSLAHSLGLLAVAEGVETREQLEFLRSEGCDEVQGYFLARPQSALDCDRLLVDGLLAKVA